eukprot:TRINITY_DN55842_c0_g1_i1.p1 TRINITY_DN55842_c0_g1~~TRINITY_DN55842_c0_g1_i1.p1  ORF type:complete len:558 (-),score=78.73 TRINITY_DN55842_c0_g1_i1:93-1766(-)
MSSPARQVSLLSTQVITVILILLGLCSVQLLRFPLPREQIENVAELARLPWISQSEIRVSWAPGAFGQAEDREFVESLSASLAEHGASARSVEGHSAEVTTLEPCFAASLVEGDSYKHCMDALEAVELHGSPREALDGSFELHVVPAADCSTLLLSTGLTALLRWNRHDKDRVVDFARKVASELASTWFRLSSFDRTASLFEVAPAYSLSFHLVGDCKRRVAWDFYGSIVSPYLQPFLDRLALLFDFEVDAQVVQCGALSDVKDTHVNAAALHDGFLRLAGQWPGDAVTRDSPWLPPLLNFVAFTSSRPLSVVDEEEQEHISFAVPGWGAVALTSTKDPHCAKEDAAKTDGSAVTIVAETLTACQSKRVASAWVGHLRSWLHLQPDGPSGEGSGAEFGEFFQCNVASRLAVVAASPRVGGITAWELRSVARGVHKLFMNRTAEALTDTSDIVDSLAGVVVRPEIASMVSEATADAILAASLFSAESISASLEASRRAVQAALAALYDETVAAHLHFSAEFRFAVYLPMAMPIGLPVIMATARQLRELMTRLRSKSAA